MQRASRSRSSVRLLFGIVGIPSIGFQCGVREQTQVNDHNSLPANHFSLHAVFHIFVVDQFLNLIYSSLAKCRKLDISLKALCCRAGHGGHFQARFLSCYPKRDGIKF
jgi:hypothetical protein